MKSIFIDAEQRNGLQGLLGKKMLQIFTQGCGLVMHDAPVIASGKQVIVYISDIENILFLKMKFDINLYNLHKDKKFKIEVQKTKKFEVDFKRFRCAISFPTGLTINSIRIFYSAFESERGSITYIQGISLEENLDRFVIFSKDESPNSFEIFINDQKSFQDLSKNSITIDKIKNEL